MRCILLLAPLLAVSCRLSPEERQAIVDEASRAAGDLAYRKAIDAGLDSDTAERARRDAQQAAAQLAEKAIPQAEDRKRNHFGGVLASVLLSLLQLASAAANGGRR